MLCSCASDLGGRARFLVGVGGFTAYAYRNKKKHVFTFGPLRFIVRKEVSLSAKKICSLSQTYLPEHPHAPSCRQSKLKTIFLGEVQNLLRGHAFLLCSRQLRTYTGRKKHVFAFVALRFIVPKRVSLSAKNIFSSSFRTRRTNPPRGSRTKLDHFFNGKQLLSQSLLKNPKNSTVHRYRTSMIFDLFAFVPLRLVERKMVFLSAKENILCPRHISLSIHTILLSAKTIPKQTDWA